MRHRGDQLKQVIGKHEIPVVVSSDGEFWAEWEGTSYHAGTFKGLRAKLLPVVREDAKRCEIEAKLLNYSGEWEDITLVGIHADNGNVLYVAADGKTAQLSRREKRVYVPLTRAELQVHRVLVGQVKKAERALRTWLATKRLEPGASVRKAIGLPPEQRDELWHDEDDDE